MWKWFGSLVLVALFAGCLNQTVSQEEEVDPAGRVVVDGLYQWVRVDLKTGDTVKTDRRFHRFRKDGTYQLSLVAYRRPFSFDTVPHADTTSRFMVWWERRGRFAVDSDSIKFSDLEFRYFDRLDQFRPWEPDLLPKYSESLAKTYRVFTRDTWITRSESYWVDENDGTVDTLYFVQQRIGDENMEIPLSELKL